MRATLAIAVAGMGLLSAHAAQAGGASLLQSCFAPAALTSRPGEQMPVKGDRRFDAPPALHQLAPYAPVPPHLAGAIRRVTLPKGQKLIALTLDLCEQPGEVAGYDGSIVDYLRANKIKATLFAGGKWMRSHAGRAQQLVVDPLFEIANHAEAHRNLRLLSGAALDNEILGPQRAYEALRTDLANLQCVAARPDALRSVPPRLGLFRFPYGACNAQSLAAVNNAGLLAIQWDLSTGDPSPGMSAQAIADQMTRNVKPGSIIIAHANGRGYHTAAALPLAIPKLLAAGYTFVTVSELLAAGTPVIASTCYDSRPGDTDRYDHPLGLRRPKLPGQSETAGVLPWSASIRAPKPGATP